jgi:hypothetical protein
MLNENMYICSLAELRAGRSILKLFEQTGSRRLVTANPRAQLHTAFMWVQEARHARFLFYAGKREEIARLATGRYTTLVHWYLHFSRRNAPSYGEVVSAIFVGVGVEGGAVHPAHRGHGVIAAPPPADRAHCAPRRRSAAGGARALSARCGGSAAAAERRAGDEDHLQAHGAKLYVVCGLLVVCGGY